MNNKTGTKVNDNVKDLVKMVENDSLDWQGNVTYAYCAGYYSSLLQTMANQVPGVEEYLAQRVQALNSLNNKAA
jgi:hypothetical protein